jgi:RNA polymerase sigma factor (sigma-70 family)
MPEIPETGSDGANLPRACVGVPESELEAWFLREVWPLEAILMQYLRQNWRDQSDTEDLLHDVYLRVYEAARTQIPDNPKAFVFTTARNLLVSRVRRHNVVPIETAADLDAIGLAIETPGPERSAIARDELRRLQTAIDHLPPRCRQVVIMRRVDDLSRTEIAARLGITEDTVSAHLRNGMSALADTFFGVPDSQKVPPP